MHGFLSALDRHLDLHSRGYDLISPSLYLVIDKP